MILAELPMPHLHGLKLAPSKLHIWRELRSFIGGNLSRSTARASGAASASATRNRMRVVI